VLDAIPRTPADDLLAAFIMCGWDQFMPIEEAERVANELATADPEKAWKLSGQLVRGEDMPPDIASWVAENRRMK
jgi:hypothetical protein